MRPPTRREALRIAGGLVAVGLAGCTGTPADGDDRGDATTTTDASGLPTRAEVVMRTDPRPKYDPGLVHVAAGGTVVWRLHSGRHDTTSYHPDTHGPQRIPYDAEPWASDRLSTVGETFERTFDVVGVYDYVDTQTLCTSHEIVGTVARIVVGWPTGEDEPGLAPPQEELPPLVRGRLEDLNEQTAALLAERP